MVGVGDFNGDGTSDVLYQNTDGSVGASLMKNGANDSWVNLSGPTSWRVVGVGDFNGDGTADVLYQNADGSVGASLMKNGENNAWVNLSGPTSWRMVGVGDFNGDGTSDVLYQNTDGSVGTSLMKNGENNAWVGLSGPTAWTVVGGGSPSQTAAAATSSAFIAAAPTRSPTPTTSLAVSRPRLFPQAAVKPSVVASFLAGAKTDPAVREHVLASFDLLHV